MILLKQAAVPASCACRMYCYLENLSLLVWMWFCHVLNIKQRRHSGFSDVSLELLDCNHVLYVWYCSWRWSRLWSADLWKMPCAEWWYFMTSVLWWIFMPRCFGVPCQTYIFPPLCFDPRCRVTPSDGDTSPTDAPGCSDRTDGATGSTGATALPTTSTLSLPVSQGKPSLRRIKGRMHRSKSLDSLDLLDSNVSLDYGSAFRSKTARPTESWFMSDLS